MKTRNFKGVVALGTALALSALGLSACSSSDQPASGAAEPESQSTTEETTPPGEAVTIDYLHRLPDGEGMVKVNEIVDKWNADHPDIQVKATKFDGQAAEMIKKLETDINADNGPCLAQLGYAEVPEMYVKGFTEDVTEYAEQYKDNFSGAYALMTVGDSVVGLPQDTGPLVYYYNKAAFEELGIEVPTTLEEFQTAAKTAAGKEKYIGVFQPDEAGYWLSAQSASAGGSWYNAENDAWKVAADSDASTAVADFWQKMLDDGSVLSIPRWGDEFGKALVDQKIIGTIGPAWDAPLLADAMADTDNVGQWAVAQIPDFGAGALTGPDGGSGVAVMKGCEYPEQAMEFNNWFNTQIDDLVSQGLVVAAKGDMETPENLKEFYGGQDVFAELATANANMTAEFGYMPYFSAVGAEMNEVAAKVEPSGSVKVADVFKKAQESSVKVLKDNGLPVAE